MTRIVLVRHGQTAWNLEARFRGRSDVPLDDFGLKQAEATGRYIAARWPVSAVYASPMGRAVQTAEAIARAHGLSAQPFQGLIDINFGELQGLLLDEAAERYPEIHRMWGEVPHTVHFPGGESLGIVRERITSALQHVVAEHTGETVALVSHTVANRVLLCAVLGLGNDRFWNLEQGTCAVNVFTVGDDGDFTVVQLNDTSHLQDLAE